MLCSSLVDTLQTETYRPEKRQAALLVINRVACSWNKMSSAAAKATIQRDAIVAMRHAALLAPRKAACL